MGRSRGQCRIDGCHRVTKAHGLCNAHYARLRAGIPLDGPIFQRGRHPRPGPKPCKVEGCDRRARCRGLCDTHSKRREDDVDRPISRSWSAHTVEGGKVCQECGVWKPNEDYYRNSERKSGFHGPCKLCESKVTVRIRLLAIEILGGCCAHCGYNEDPRVLEIDHINGGGVADRREKGFHVARRVVRRGDVEGLQLLCANCHRIKTRKDVSSLYEEAWELVLQERV